MSLLSQRLAAVVVLKECVLAVIPGTIRAAIVRRHASRAVQTVLAEFQISVRWTRHGK